MKKTAIIFLSAVVAVLLAAVILSRLLVSGESVAEYISEELGEEFTVSVADASLNPLTLSMKVTDIAIGRIAGESEQELLQIENFTIGGIGIISAARGDLSARKVTLRNFYLDADALQRGLETDRLNSNTSNTSSFTISSVEFQNGIISLSGGAGGVGEIHDVNLVAGPFSCMESNDNCSLWSHMETLEVEISSISYSTEDGHYTFSGDDFRISADDGIMKIGRLALVPDLEDDEFLESLDYRQEYFRFVLSELSVRQFDFESLRDQGEIIAGSVNLNSLDIQITLDKRLPEDPDKDEALMPAEALRSLSGRVAIDTVQIHHSDIYYSEYATDGVRPGTVLFGDTNILLTGIDSHSDRSSRVRVHSQLEGAGELQVEFRFPLGDGDVISEVTGSLEQFNISLLNNMFEDLEGMRFRDGILHDLDFSFTMHEEQSEGTIVINYEDLSVEMIDKVDHRQDIVNTVRSFFTDRVALRSSSDNERSGEISQERDRDKSFFNYLWTSLRSGIYDVVQRI